MTTSATTPAINVSNVCFGYGTQEVLHNVSFEISPLSLVAIVGPNGGGKTTLLKLLLGAETPRYGIISILGTTPTKARSRIGYVPQSTPFDDRFPVSVIEVVLMGQTARHPLGFYNSQARRAAHSALERVNMQAFAKRSFTALSGGERQRVMIAQALASSPQLLLLDEPVANVDPENASHLYELFSQLSSDLTILMVSHNLGVVTGHATHVLCVNRTAGIHAIGEVASTTFREAFGGQLTAINHGIDCHVADPSNALSQPHSACCPDHAEEVP